MASASSAARDPGPREPRCLGPGHVDGDQALERVRASGQRERLVEERLGLGIAAADPTRASATSAMIRVGAARSA